MQHPLQPILDHVPVLFKEAGIIPQPLPEEDRAKLAVFKAAQSGFLREALDTSPPPKKGFPPFIRPPIAPQRTEIQQSTVFITLTHRLATFMIENRLQGYELLDRDETYNELLSFLCDVGERMGYKFIRPPARDTWLDYRKRHHLPVPSLPTTTS